MLQDSSSAFSLSIALVLLSGFLKFNSSVLVSTGVGVVTKTKRYELCRHVYFVLLVIGCMKY
jgi:hypothetical protein